MTIAFTLALGLAARYERKRDKRCRAGAPLRCGGS